MGVIEIHGARELTEEAVELGVDHVGDLLEGLRVVAELTVVAIDDDEVAFVAFDPLLVAFAESLEVIDAYALLELAASLLDLCDERGYGAADVNHQVGQLDEGHHEVEEVGVVVEVAVAHVALGMEVGGKDACILENGAVLNDGFGALANLHDVLEALVQEVDLEVERPAAHVLIEIVEIGVVVDGLEACRPAVVGSKELGEGGFATTYVSCDGDMHFFKLRVES